MDGDKDAKEETKDAAQPMGEKKSGKVEKVSTAPQTATEIGAEMNVKIEQIQNMAKSVPTLDELIESNQKYTQRLNRAAGLIRGFPRKLKRDFLICMKWEEENGV